MKDYVKEKPVIIENGEGVILRDIEGNEYIDGISSMWCNIHGHRKKRLMTPSGNSSIKLHIQPCLVSQMYLRLNWQKADRYNA